MQHVNAAVEVQEVSVNGSPSSMRAGSSVYTNNLQMREERKVGVGLGVGVS